jgi:anti-anti-sigma regulatory factor
MTAPPRLHHPLVVMPFLDGPRTVVVVAGDAGTATAARLREQLIGALAFGTRSLVVDLTDLAGCDRHGADALSEAVRFAEARGTAVSLRGQSPHVAQLLGTQDHR